MTIMYKFLCVPTTSDGSWPDFTWQQCILGSPLPRQLKAGFSLWSLLRGIVLWISWITKNALCFQAEHWTSTKVEILIWDTTLDYVRMAWKHATFGIHRQLAWTARILQHFDDAWCSSHLLLHSYSGFFFLVAKYGGRTYGWWLVANTPTRGSPSIFCSQKKEPCSYCWFGYLEFLAASTWNVRVASFCVLMTVVHLCQNKKNKKTEVPYLPAAFQDLHTPTNVACQQRRWPTLDQRNGLDRAYPPPLLFH
jgi:hypothetical protein